jgi:hypothetical protein
VPIAAAGEILHDQAMLLTYRDAAKESVRADRRRTSRFPIQQDIRYRLKDAQAQAGGVGRTIDIGSSGVLFTTDRPLSIGGVVEASVDWPALLDGACGLRLVVSGPVVRSNGNQAAIRIERYEFRTRALRAN